MERVSASLIEEIRSALVERYNRDQEIQQMIEEIGAEEGLNEKELSVIYQAYLEVKERMQYTANLMELWNQIETVQDRMSMLNSYESLERDLFGDVLSFDKPMGYGASNQDNLDYAMEQIKLQDIDTELENIEMAKDYLINKKDSNSNMKDIDLAKEYPIDDQDIVYFNEHSANKKTTSNRYDVNDVDFDDDEDDFDDESVLDRDVRTSLDPYDMVNSLLYSKQSGDDTTKTKQQKEIDKLIKKQLKRVEEEWAKLSGKNDKKDKKKKDKDTKKDKKDKQSKKESELVKESKKSKKDKESKKSKKDKDSKKDKKNKDAKKDKKAKKLEKALKKESKKSTKKD